MEQTVESIKHAQESGCKIIVAINKIDRASEKQLQKCKNDLLQYGLIPEEMGGEVQVVPISALKKINLDLLKEEIWAQAEIMDLKGDPKGLVEGYIIESTQDIYKGKIATVLIKRGTLRKGSYLVAGNTWCKVKSLCDENLVNINQASLSQAVQVMGWKDLPNAGDEVLEFEKENLAKNLIELRLKIEALKKLKKEREIIEKKRKDYDDLYQIKSQERREKGLRFIHDCLYDKNGEIINLNKKEGADDKKQFQPKIKHIILKTDVNGIFIFILS
jgi:translation initiation factor IF-2